MTCHQAAFLHMLLTVYLFLICPTLLSSRCKQRKVEIGPWEYKETRLTALTGSRGPNFFQSKHGTVTEAPSCCNTASPMERTPLWQQDPGHWGHPWLWSFSCSDDTCGCWSAEVQGLHFPDILGMVFLTRDGELHPWH